MVCKRIKQIHRLSVLEGKQGQIQAFQKGRRGGQDWGWGGADAYLEGSWERLADKSSDKTKKRWGTVCQGVVA